MLKKIKDPNIKIALAFLLVTMPYLGLYLAVLILIALG